MRRHRLFIGVGGLIVAATIGLALIGSASAAPGDPINHGISFTKGCASPTQIGQPYSCTYSIRNVIDEARDTLTINGLTDTVHSAGGDVSSGNVFGSLRLEIGPFLAGFSTPPSCPGATGTGTAADPFRGPGLTSCILPFGSRLNVQSFSFYTVQAADFNLPGHALTDSAELAWHDLCNDPAGTGNSNCNSNPPNAGAGSQTIVNGLPSTTATTIHNAAHAAVTAVAVGTTVHDFVTVSGGAGNPVPTGNVTVDWFLNGTCTGAPASTSPATPLGPAGTVDVTGFSFTVNSPGGRSFRAHYAGDALYLASNGPCEPLQVVDANVSITPNGTNPVGSTHTFTGHVNVNDGSGFVNAPAGTTITFTIDSGPGSFVGGVSSCNTVAATGSCTVTITSAVPGTTVVSAHTTVSVAGVSVTRDTNGTGGNSGPATKLWVDSAVRTDIHNATHSVITTAQPGDVVHDKVFVTKAAGTPAAVPNPTGQVTFHRYSTIDCTGPAVNETVNLAADGTAETGTFTVTGDMSYRADYLGSPPYPAKSGACEPLSVAPPPPSVCPSCPPPPCPAFPVFPGQPGPGGPCSFDVLDTSVKGTLVEITIQNNSSNGDAAMTALHISWPASNGALKSVVLDGQLYTGPPLTGGSANLTFSVNPLLRTIKVGQSEKLRLVFEKNADQNTAHYTGSVDFGACNIAIF
jgi:hypothetical protein